MPKSEYLKDNLKFIDESDTFQYSCQEKEDLESGTIQWGNRIVAHVGIQMLLNLVRGKGNKILNVVI